MGFELRKKGKFEEANKFVERIQEIQREAKVALVKVQKDMKKYVDRHKGESSRRSCAAQHKGPQVSDG